MPVGKIQFGKIDSGKIDFGKIKIWKRLVMVLGILGPGTQLSGSQEERGPFVSLPTLVGGTPFSKMSCWKWLGTIPVPKGRPTLHRPLSGANKNCSIFAGFVVKSLKKWCWCKLREHMSEVPTRSAHKSLDVLQLFFKGGHLQSSILVWQCMSTGRTI